MATVLKFQNSNIISYFPDPKILSVPDFVKIGPETAKEFVVKALSHIQTDGSVL